MKPSSFGGIMLTKELSINRLVRTIAIVLAICLLISIIPLVIVSFYSHPLADDFSFSATVHNAVETNGGFWGIISAAANQVISSYQNWQGTYAAIFIFSMQPGAFSESLYFFTTIIILFALIFSTCYFINTIFKVLHLNRYCGIIIMCILLLLSIHFVIDKFQAFYWWNGCTYYSLFYSFSLVFFSIVIRLNYCAKKTRIAYFVFALLLTILIGGGNYSTALISVVIVSLIVISVIAPGNSVRAKTVGGTTPLKAIILSIYYSITCIAEWTGLIQIAAFSVVFVMACFLTKKMNFSFKYPLVVIVLSILVFATQLTPPLYGMNNIGSGRQINIYYYSYHLLITFILFYISGWLNKRNLMSINSKEVKRSHIAGALLLIICVFLCGCMSYRLHNVSFIDTTISLKNNIPQTYSSEYMDAISEIKSGKHEVHDIQTVPDYFLPLNIKKTPDFWINQAIARYYNVGYITLDDR